MSTVGGVERSVINVNGDRGWEEHSGAEKIVTVSAG